MLPYYCTMCFGAPSATMTETVLQRGARKIVKNRARARFSHAAFPWQYRGLCCVLLRPHYLIHSFQTVCVYPHMARRRARLCIQG